MSDDSSPTPRPTPAEVAELARRRPDGLGARLEGLGVREQAELVMRVPADARVRAILHAPRPMRLARSLPDADLYLTIREAGPVDAAPLVRLASASQLEHLMDMEAWRGESFDPERGGAWLALMVECGDATLRRFLRATDDELLATLFVKWIRVDQLEFEDGTADKHGHGLSEAGETRGLVTPDGGYRFSPLIPEHAAPIRRLLQFMYVEQADRYFEILWATRSDLPSEIEEQALHWRRSRLEEHGFPGPEEAQAIYRPPAGVTVRPTVIQGPTDPDALPTSRTPLALLGDDPLATAIERLEPAERERALAETTALVNRVLVADGLDAGDPAHHRRAAARAAGLVRVGLEARGIADPADAAQVLAEVPVVELFREGWDRAAALGREAGHLATEGWASRHPAALELLDSPVRERVAALLGRRPLYVPVDATGVGEPREFATAAEIEETRVALELATTVGTLFADRLGLDVARSAAADDATTTGVPRFSTQLLTLLAWHAVRGELRGDPLPEDVTADFLRTVASRRTAAPDAGRRALEMAVRTLTDRFGLDAREVALLQAFGRSSLRILAEECGSLDPGVPVDGRHVSCLLLAAS